MTTVAAPQPIPGKPIDPEREATPEVLRKLDEADGATGVAAGVGIRAKNRFTFAQTTLLAAGTTYYVFLALFSIVALGYGVTALFGADRIADYLTTALTEAFPGLIGDDGIDPERLKAIGQTASIIGLVTMAYSGSGAMTATSGSIHLIYGAPPDPRNYVVKKLRLLGWLLIVGPLILASLVAGIAVQNFSHTISAEFGWDGTVNRVLITTVGIAITLLLDVLVIWLMLANLGGIRPERRPLLIGSIVGAFAVQILRVVMGLVLRFSADKPEYGALTLPIGILLVLYLNAIAVFGVAALTAAIAERNVPLDELAPAIDLEEVQLEAEPEPDAAEG